MSFRHASGELIEVFRAKNYFKILVFAFRWSQLMKCSNKCKYKVRFFDFFMIIIETTTLFTITLPPLEFITFSRFLTQTKSKAQVSESPTMFLRLIAPNAMTSQNKKSFFAHLLKRMRD